MDQPEPSPAQLDLGRNLAEASDPHEVRMARATAEMALGRLRPLALEIVISQSRSDRFWRGLVRLRETGEPLCLVKGAATEAAALHALVPLIVARAPQSAATGDPGLRDRLRRRISAAD